MSRPDKSPADAIRDFLEWRGLSDEQPEWFIEALDKAGYRIVPKITPDDIPESKTVRDLKRKDWR